MRAVSTAMSSGLARQLNFSRDKADADFRGLLRTVEYFPILPRKREWYFLWKTTRIWTLPAGSAPRCKKLFCSNWILVVMVSRARSL